MSRVWRKISSYILNQTFQGVDRAGNQYFTRTQLIDGVIEWISWLNGQRKRASTPEEMAELEAKRERVNLNVARRNIINIFSIDQVLKKEEEEWKAKEGTNRRSLNTGKVGGPDLKSFIQQFPAASEDDKVEDTLNANNGKRSSEQAETEKVVSDQAKHEPESSEPTGSGQSFRPGHGNLQRNDFIACMRRYK